MTGHLLIVARAVREFERVNGRGSAWREALGVLVIGIQFGALAWLFAVVAGEFQ